MFPCGQDCGGAPRGYGIGSPVLDPQNAFGFNLYHMEHSSENDFRCCEFFFLRRC